ncbi:amino acid adenylation domain-containing protein [Dactylosporangium sucinum]|uniref:Carrier domain-containing protein n=1 Tax=Dactylosporangium sucinum TaxID=1424081 RepID=A0A917WRW2_9ACTN|nr:non-ribosomal peptide synthetase [Dactylosporangium sucinum]GGM23878.1 hypothetical protein GCM10007977_026290 [Dactylosporangium sucinum]
MTTPTQHPSTYVHAQIWRQANRRPGAPAVVDVDDRVYSYENLVEQADRVADHLVSLGVGPDQVVGVSYPRSMTGLVHLLGVLRSGGAVLYLDPEWPQSRLDFMLSACNVSIVVSEARGVERLDAHHIGPAIDSGRAPLAYVIFTSGSTGTPRGVLIEHPGVVNMTTALASLFEVHEGTRMLQFSAWSWDAAMCEILVTLAAGGTLVLAPQEARVGGTELANLLRRHAVEVVTLTPSVLDAVPVADLPNLRTVVSVGEPCHAGLVRRWTTRDRRVYNGYGPTEATVAATITDGLTPGDDIHIGTPLPNVYVRVLDDAGREVPVGATGELLLGGVGVARGYAQNPRLTAARFTTDSDGIRWYRTGDLVSPRPDGALTYVGRSDDQVKLRGNRVELGEVEQMLRTHPAVRSCAVVVFADRLIAYVVGSDPDAGDTDVREAVRSQALFWLPEHMRPSEVHVVTELPLTVNGKLDRVALAGGERSVPAIVVPAIVVPATVTPRSDDGLSGAAADTSPDPVLTRVMEIVQRVLQVPVAADHDVFEVGAHSLLAAELSVHLAEAFGVDVAYQDVILHRTAADLAGLISGRIGGLMTTGGVSSTSS